MIQRRARIVSLWVVSTLILLGACPFGIISAQEAQPTTAPLAAPASTATPIPRPVAADPTVKAAAPELAALQTGLVQVYERVNPSVVTVWGAVDAYWEDEPEVDEEGVRQRAMVRAPSSKLAALDLPVIEYPLGSGFIWDMAGHIVTNNHVITGGSTFSIAFADGLRVPAELVAQESESDLAVLKVDPTGLDLPPIAVGDSTKVRVGQPVIVIGNPFGFYEGSLSFGVVSALGRSLLPEITAEMLFKPTYQIPDIIQTDAAINPGNSGGVMVDMAGQLLGVPAAGVDQAEGLGLVIPSVIVKQVVPALIEAGQYEYPWLGIYSSVLTPDLVKAMKLLKTQRGAFVLTVAADSPADAAGLRGSDRLVVTEDQALAVGGDLITAIDDQPVRRPEDLDIYLIRDTRVGDDVILSFLRGRAAMTATLTVAARPDEDAEVSEAQPTDAEDARVWLGIAPFTLTPEVAEAMAFDPDRTGVLIQTLVKGSPADQAKLRGGYKTYTLESGYTVTLGGDVIIAIDDRPVADVDGLLAALQGKSPGDAVTLTILRDSEQLDVAMVLGVPPAGTM